MFKNIIFLLISILFLSCTNKTDKKIADIPEASGISFCRDTDTLVVANDEGYMYEISTKGKILKKHYLGKYDLEGVVCDKNRYIFADEKGGLLYVDRKSLKKTYRSLRLKLPKNAGIEGIEKINNKLYLAIQAKKKSKSKILVVTPQAKIIKSIKTHITDMSGLSYYKNRFYIISDHHDKIYLYDLKKEKILKKYKVKKSAQEGITFDEKGSLYIADDNGKVFKREAL